MVPRPRPGPHRLPRAQGHRVPRLAARDADRQGAPPRAPGRGAQEGAAAGLRDDPDRLGPGRGPADPLARRRSTPRSCSRWSRRNRERLRPWMPWEPTTQGPDDTRAFIALVPRLRDTTSRPTACSWTARSSAPSGCASTSLANARGDRVLDRRGARGPRDRDARRRAVPGLRVRRAGPAPHRAARRPSRTRGAARWPSGSGMREEGVLREAERVARRLPRPGGLRAPRGRVAPQRA